VLTVIIVFLGVQPSWLVRWSEKTTSALVAAVPIETQTVIATSGVTFTPRMVRLSAPSIKP
jgi:NADH:ubiquinone oxidoreductase subunit 4 (subunit M)